MQRRKTNWITFKFIMLFYCYIFRKETKRFMCPVNGCGMEVINLPRHLQRKPHLWSKQSANAAVGLFKLRKSTKGKKPVKSAVKSAVAESHKARICPISICSKIINKTTQAPFGFS